MTRHALDYPTARTWPTYADPPAQPACRSPHIDPEIFYPHEGAHTVVDHAKAVCARCEVLDDCRAWALETGQHFGIWGALTPGERDAVARRRHLAQRLGLTDPPQRPAAAGCPGPTRCPAADHGYTHQHPGAAP